MEERKGLPPEAYEEVPGESYKPYISSSQTIPELTAKALLLGAILGVVFGAANAYLGLKVGMTVCASIPAAVISMAILRGILRRGTILENNIVQTVGSSGEALAAGVIFTIPALIIWGIEPRILKVFLISVSGGILGVLFMIPLRRFLILKEHGRLPYPEGTACAEVLVAGDRGGSRARLVFSGVGIAALYKFVMGGLGAWEEHPHWDLSKSLNMKIGLDALPALLGVGFIVGPRIASYMFAGGALGWLVIIPIITIVGRNLTAPVFPAAVLISQMDADAIWTNYIRYIGAGAVALGGLASLIRAAPTIVSSIRLGFREVTKGLRERAGQRTSRDIPMKWVLLGAVLVAVGVGAIPQVPVGFTGAILVVVFSFFFVTVSSRIVGLIGSSSNPASGMTIATLLATSLILLGLGWKGEAGMVAALSVGAIVCVAICVAGDISQDLKTGFLLGGTPFNQQIGQLLGVLVSALVIGWTVLILHRGYGIGSSELPAPQATLMSMVVKGVMTRSLPWTFVFIGMGVAFVLEVLRLPSLPFAVGLYLPIELSTPIMAGGIMRGLLERKGRDIKERRERGILYSSGLVAGDALVGIILAILVWRKIDLTFAEGWMGGFSNWGSLVVFGGIIYLLSRVVFGRFRSEGA